MGRRNAGTVFLSILFVIVSIANVFGQCTLEHPCEKPLQDLVTGNKWNGPGSVETVTFNIQMFPPPNMPNLVNDVTFAATQWTDVWFNNETVKFQLYYGGKQDKLIPRKDWYNMIGWGDTVVSNFADTTVYLDPDNLDRIIECDTVFNYYQP